MVLDFGLIKSGLFTESELTGVGLGSDDQQTIVGDYTGDFYVQRTDTSGSNYTHNNATPTLKVTFAFGGLDASYVLKAIEFLNLSFSDGSANGNDYSQLSMEIDDGTTYWACAINRLELQAPGVAGSYIIAGPVYWSAHTPSSPGVLISTASSIVCDSITIPIAMNVITGATTYYVRLYMMATQTSGNTCTLTKGFTIKLIFSKAIKNLNTATAQA